MSNGAKSDAKHALTCTRQISLSTIWWLTKWYYQRKKNSHLSFLPSLITMVRRNLMNGNEERILDGLNKQLSFCTTQNVLCTKSGARQLASSTSTAYLNNFTMLICSFYRVTFKMRKASWGSVIVRIPKSQGDTALHSLSPDNFSLWSESANSTYWRKSLLEFCASCTRPPTPPWLRHPWSLSSLLACYKIKMRQRISLVLLPATFSSLFPQNICNCLWLLLYYFSMFLMFTRSQNL